MATTRQPVVFTKKPDWFKVRKQHSDSYVELKHLVHEGNLHTVCEEARCPNIYECWSKRTATFMILGDLCTRSCRFCGVKWGRPSHVDRQEPTRVADAVEKLGLKFAVVTSVNRDDLNDGGAGIFADTIREIRDRLPDCGVEVLIPDFQANWDALKLVIDAQPEIISHNVETVPRLFRRVQPWDNWDVSLDLFSKIREFDPLMITKSGIMVGLGETHDEIIEVMHALRERDVDILTIGQYLPPSKRHFPLQRYYELQEFEDLRAIGEEIGFGHVESGPMVRSSYHAGDQADALRLNRLRNAKQARSA
ncbi:MAG TPA: lipoyl synthase [Nitrolancea sp.]|nr:lipoyl synthase [Nitrolancea sp.]